MQTEIQIGAPSDQGAVHVVCSDYSVTRPVTEPVRSTVWTEGIEDDGRNREMIRDGRRAGDWDELANGH